MVIISKMQHRFKVLFTAKVLIAACSTKAKNINTEKKNTNFQGC
jgi:hypothetical protein